VPPTLSGCKTLRMESIITRLLAEFLGTALLVTTVVGAGHMVTHLGAGPALGLLMIGLAVGFMLVIIIAIFQPISGAHFNPAVSLVMALRKQLPPKDALLFAVSQSVGAIVGAVTANLMFGSQALVISDVARSGSGVWLGEAVATFGLVLAILLLVDQGRTPWIPAAVGLWVAAGHIFTSSTSFANPAVSIGRMFTDAPTGVAPSSALWFFVFQILGALLAWGASQAFSRERLIMTS